MPLFQPAPTPQYFEAQEAGHTIGPATARMLVCRRPDRLLALLHDMQQHPNADIHFVSRGDWNLHDFFNAALPLVAPASLHITTYAIYEYPLRQILLAQQDGLLTDVNMLLDSRSKAHMPETFALAHQLANKIRLASIHAKVMVLQGAKGSVTIIGSQNWTNNPRVETGLATMNQAVATFHTTWIHELLNHADPFK